MDAIAISEPGGPDVLEWVGHPDPDAGEGEVVVEVVASAVNRADVMQRKGHYPPPPGASEVPGLECSGRIVELGSGVTGWSVGDEVCALLSGGGYAERVAVPVGQLLPVPAGVSLTEAAGLPEVACTVWSNLVMEAGLGAGRTLLVQGGSGGIGTHAIQVGAALGATVYATAGHDDRLALCRELGATAAIDYHDDVAAEIDRLTDGRGVDVVLDHLGASNLEANLKVLALGGRLQIIGLMGGAKGEINLGAMLTRRLSVAATNLRGRPAEGPGGKAEIVAQVREHLWPLVEAGRVRPVVHEYVPVAEASRAHAAMEGGGVVGKLVLVVQ